MLHGGAGAANDVKEKTEIDKINNRKNFILAIGINKTVAIFKFLQRATILAVLGPRS